MKTKFTIDFKSLALGAGAAAILIFSTAAIPGSGTLGHYQIAVGGDGRAAILDTMSGKCWTAAISSSGEVGNVESAFIKAKDGSEGQATSPTGK